MNAVFLDTSYLLALEVGNDQNHGKARAHWEALAGAVPPLVTTSCVFGEVVTFLSSRGQHAKAVEVGNRLLHSLSLEFVHVDRSLFDAG
jgi:predicted nucleic acid-binding protein